MSTLTRWNPFQEMEALHSRLSNLLGTAAVRSGDSREVSAVANWAPLVDITEDEKEYHIKAELPEVSKDAVKVTVENGVLTISGDRKFVREEKGKKYHRVERTYGTFARSFSVPDDADENQVTADFKDGVLNVKLVKSEKAKPKSIEVKLG